LFPLTAKANPIPFVDMFNVLCGFVALVMANEPADPEFEVLFDENETPELFEFTISAAAELAGLLIENTPAPPEVDMLLILIGLEAFSAFPVPKCEILMAGEVFAAFEIFRNNPDPVPSVEAWITFPEFNTLEFWKFAAANVVVLDVIPEIAVPALEFANSVGIEFPELLVTNLATLPLEAVEVRSKEAIAGTEVLCE
jgi:hypothetical protein